MTREKELPKINPLFKECLREVGPQVRDEVRKNMDSIARACVEAYGEEAQKMMMIEECSELIQALAKEHRGREADVITEIADVQCMLWQMKLIYGEDAVDAEIERKMRRQQERLVERQNAIENGL